MTTRRIAASLPVIALGAIAILLITCDTRQDGRLSTGTVQRLQERLKADENWPSWVRRLIPLTVNDRMAVDYLRSPVGLTVSTGRIIRVLDNLTGTIHRLDMIARSQGLLETSFRHPQRFREYDGSFYTTSAYGLHRLRDSGDVISTLRSKYSVADFRPLDDGSYVVNPLSRDDGSPLVGRLDATGTITREWGRVSTMGLPAGAMLFLGRARLDVCEGWIVAARLYAPSVQWFSMEGDERCETPLPIPGRDELSEMLRRPALVNPSPGYYQFPTFTNAISCLGDVAYALLDLPFLAVARLERHANPVVLIANDTELNGRRWAELVVRRGPRGIIELYSLAQDTNSENWEVVRATVEEDKVRRE